MALVRLIQLGTGTGSFSSTGVRFDRPAVGSLHSPVAERATGLARIEFRPDIRHTDLAPTDRLHDWFVRGPFLQRALVTVPIQPLIPKIDSWRLPPAHQRYARCFHAEIGFRLNSRKS